MNSLSCRVFHPFPAGRLFPTLVLFLTVLLWSPAARAAVVSWTNAAGGDWSLSGNWDTGQVPNATDSVQITLDGTYSVTVGANVKVQSLLVGAISGVQTVEASTCTLMVSGM